MQVDSLTKEHIDKFQCKYRYVEFKDDMLFSIDNPSREVYLLHDHKNPAAILGMNHTHGGSADVWMVPSIYYSKHALRNTKELRNIIDGQLSTEMHRFQMYVKYGWREGIKWARVLGFKLEGIARYYNTNGEDFYCYAKTRGDVWQPVPQLSL